MLITDAGDEEVSTYVGSHMTDSSSSTEPTDVNLTAESVQQFMKTVNRIRYSKPVTQLIPMQSACALCRDLAGLGIVDCYENTPK